MSDTRTGNRTPLCKRRHSTGQIDIDKAKTFDRAGSFYKQQRKVHSESSAGSAEHSDVSSSHWNHDRQLMTSESSFYPAEERHKNSQSAFKMRDSDSRDLETSHAGSWCKKNVRIPQTSDFFSDPALGPHPYDGDERSASIDNKTGEDKPKSKQL